VSESNYQTYLDTAVEEGWLTTDDSQAWAAWLTENQVSDPLATLVEQGVLTPEQIAWIDSPSSPDEEEETEQVDTEPVQTGGSTPQEQVQEPEREVALGDDGLLPFLNDYLKVAKQMDASDFHFGVSSPPLMRLHGKLQPIFPDSKPLEPEQTEAKIFDMISEVQKKQLLDSGEIDFSYDIEGTGRFRSSIVKQRLGYDAVFRLINSKVRTMDELGIPEHLKILTKFQNGLVLITGPAGSGKSTTMAAFIEEVNRQRHDHIITLEDPIEYVFEPSGCHISQREVHTHTESFSAALRGALREDPDVIMVGEMRDLETISLAITAGETGHLVFGTLHTSSAGRTLDRVLDAFPVEQQAQIRTMVAGSLRGIVSQQLIPRIDGSGRVLALEILINTMACASLIREGKTFMLPGVMQTGKKAGCRTMDDALKQLLLDELISAEEAYARADQKDMFKEYLPEAVKEPI